MQQIQIMSLHEKLQIGMKAIEQRNKGNMEEFERISRSIPMPPFMAKFAKDYIGADFLIKGGWNLSEAEAEFGPDWLTQ